MRQLREIQLELAGTCNLACSYCTWTGRETGKGMMSADLALDLIDEIARFEPPPLLTLHSIGESTTNPHFLTILKHTEKLGLFTRLSSNCTLLCGNLADKVAESPRLEMILAIHGGVPRKTLETCVANALDYLARRPVNRKVQVLSVCSMDNPLAPMWFCETFMPLIERLPQARLFFKQPQTWPRADPVAGYIPQGPSHPQIDIDIIPTPRSLGRGCDMPNFFLAVQADGTMAPCCVAQENWGLPNIDRTTLHDVWESDRMEDIRRLWHKADDSLPCGHCLKRTDC